MPIFLLIRHGETDYNKKMHFAGRLPEVHLNQRGRSKPNCWRICSTRSDQGYLFQPAGADHGNC